MLTDSSVISPVVVLGSDDKTFQPLYNYAYIPNLHRFYFIDDIVWKDGLWNVYLRVDTLATYKTAIRKSTQYVIRSSSNYDTNITDTFYKTKELTLLDRVAVSKYNGISDDGTKNVSYKQFMSGSLQSTTYTDTNHFAKGISSGKFVLGVVGNNATGVTYYGFSYTDFKEFINKAMVLVPSNMNDVSTGVANAIYDPIQYITSCRWYPTYGTLTNDARTHNVKLGPQTITLDGWAWYVGDIQGLRFEIEISIPHHPQSSNEGYQYMDLAPYSEYNLMFQPFGNIPLDPSKIKGWSSLYCYWDVDIKAGIAHLFISDCGKDALTPGKRAAVMYDQIVNYGVDVPISGLVYDWKAGLALSAATWLKNNYGEQLNSFSSIASLFGSSNKASTGESLTGSETASPSTTSLTNVDLLDKGMDILGGALGQVRTAGTSGSYMSYQTDVPYIYAFFYGQVDHDLLRFGAPSYKSIMLANCSGFILCENASFSITDFNIEPGFIPTHPEMNALVQWLNSGIYLE